MKVIYETKNIDSLIYITGWFTPSPDHPNGIELDPQLQNIVDWYDENQNPLWILNPDGTVAPVVKTPVQINSEALITQANNDISTNQDVLNRIMTDIVDCLLNKKTISNALLTKWNQAHQSIQSAYGSTSGIVKG